MLIKVEVDSEIVRNQDKAEAYAENHCNSFEYALCDWYYPDLSVSWFYDEPGCEIAGYL